MTMESVLITGGAGYIGSVLTGRLLDKRYKVTCLDNLKYNQNSLMIYAHDSNFEFVYGDAKDSNLVKKLVAKADNIIPLAALVGMPLCDKNPKDAESTNKNAIVMLNKIRNNSQKLIYPNTNSGYGAQSGETYCTEETPLEPISLYGKLKCQTEKHLLKENKDVIT